ncbi:MAG: hypothetical protein C4327_07475 [Meiothermus sp.]
MAVLAACGGPASKDIEGTLSAPGSLQGSLVLVCPANSNDCSDGKELSVSATGRSAPYKVEGLEDLDYFVFAFKDIDGDGDLTPGDYFGYYGYPNDLKGVRPPAKGIDIQMQVVRSRQSLPAPFGP